MSNVPEKSKNKSHDMESFYFLVIDETHLDDGNDNNDNQMVVMFLKAHLWQRYYPLKIWTRRTRMGVRMKTLWTLGLGFQYHFDLP